MKSKIEIVLQEDQTSDDALVSLMNDVYRVSVHYFEHIGERTGFTDGKKLRGNGHHMSQELCAYAEKIFKERLIDKK